MTEVLDVRAVQHGSWWMVSVPGMPGLLAQVTSLEPRLIGAALATSSASADTAEISVRRVVQVGPVQPAQQAALGSRQQPGAQGGSSGWAQQAMRATRLAPRRVAELLAS